jgi:hypothetical protein
MATLPKKLEEWSVYKLLNGHLPLAALIPGHAWDLELLLSEVALGRYPPKSCARRDEKDRGSSVRHNASSRTAKLNRGTNQPKIKPTKTKKTL